MGCGGMPVRRTLMPVVEAVAIQDAKLEVQRSIEHSIALGSYQNWVVPSDALQAPLQGMARYGLIVHDNGDDRHLGYMEDLVFVCCCHPACERVFRLDWCQPVSSITRRQLYKCRKHLARVHGVRL